MLQLKKRQNEIKTRRKDEINKIKSRVLLFLEYPHDTGGKLLWKVSNYLPNDMASYPRKRVHSETQKFVRYMICKPKFNERKRVLAHTTMRSEKANALVQMRHGSYARFPS